MFTVICETCKKVVAGADSISEAVEIARFEMDADCHEETGEWKCAECYAAYMAEGAAIARTHVPAFETTGDPIRDYLIQKGEI